MRTSSPSVLRLVALLLLVSAFGVAAPSAQAHASINLSGRWTDDAGRAFTIAQDSLSLTVTHTGGNAYPHWAEIGWLANGRTSTKSTYAWTNGQPVTTISTAQWNGDALVITTLVYVNDTDHKPVILRDRLTIDGSGRLMVESTRDGAPTGSKLYRKVS